MEKEFIGNLNVNATIDNIYKLFGLKSEKYLCSHTYVEMPLKRKATFAVFFRNFLQGQQSKKGADHLYYLAGTTLGTSSSPFDLLLITGTVSTVSTVSTYSKHIIYLNRKLVDATLLGSNSALVYNHIYLYR